MRNSVKLLIAAAVLAVIIVGAALLYKPLSENYQGDNLATTPQSQQNDINENPNAAPDFTVLDSSGKEVKLSDFKGKPVVLNFWATWCYYCKEEMPDFEEASKSHPEVQFLMVNATDGVQETEAAARKYIEDEGYTFDVFFDTELEAVNNYYVTGFPSTYFIDAEGNLVTYRNGMIDAATLEQGIEMITQ